MKRLQNRVAVEHTSPHPLLDVGESNSVHSTALALGRKLDGPGEGIYRQGNTK